MGSRALVRPMGTDSAQSRPPARSEEKTQVPRLVSGEQGEGLAGGFLTMSILVLPPVPGTSSFIDPETS